MTGDSPLHGETGDGGDGMEVQSGDVLSVEGHRELSATTYSERTATGELEYGVDENEWLAVLEREFGITPDGPRSPGWRKNGWLRHQRPLGVMPNSRSRTASHSFPSTPYSSSPVAVRSL